MSATGFLALTVLDADYPNKLITYKGAADADPDDVLWSSIRITVPNDFVGARFKRLGLYTPGTTTVHPVVDHERGNCQLDRGGNTLFEGMPMFDIFNSQLGTSLPDPNVWIGTFFRPFPIRVRPGDIMTFYVPPAEDHAADTGVYRITNVEFDFCEWP
jgi:hypothetical protein